MTFPNPNEVTAPIKDESGELTENEYGVILDKTLSKKNRKDGSVIAFIDCFIRSKSISQASAECGIHQSVGYSYRHRKDIANAIQKLIDKSNVKYGFDATEIMERAKEIVDFDPISMQNSDGTYKSNMHDIEPEARRSIKKLKVKNVYSQVEDLNGIKTKVITGEIIEYEFYDKLKSIELVGKEKEMFKNTTRIEHDVTKNMQSVLLASTERAEKHIEDSKITTMKVVEVVNVES